MKILIVFFVILHSTCNCSSPPSPDLNTGMKTSDPEETSKSAPGPSPEAVNRTEDVQHNESFGFRQENTSTDHSSTPLGGSNYSQTTMEERSLDSHEEHQTDSVHRLPQQHHNSTDSTDDDEILPTKIQPKIYREEDTPSQTYSSTPSSSKGQEYVVENSTINVKIGKFVNVTCGPDDISKLLETNLGKNLSLANMSWQWKVMWLNHSNDKGADGIQISESHGVIILSIPSFRAEHSGTYTCAAQDFSSRVWILKNLELVAIDLEEAGIIERSSAGSSDDNQSFPPPPPPPPPSTSLKPDFTDRELHQTIRSDVHDPPLHQDHGEPLNSTELHPFISLELNSAYINRWTSLDNFQPLMSSESSDLSSTDSPPPPGFAVNSSRGEDDDGSPTHKTLPSAEDSTTSSNTSEEQIVGEPAKSEEQKALKEDQEEAGEGGEGGENNTSGVAIGVALAILLTAVATTLVLYRHRRNGKKSTYITFGNPSYSRENLPANDYGLDSPLTLSSNGYTVLA